MDQLMHSALEQRLAARDLHQIGWEHPYVFDDLLDGEPASFGERVLGIAPSAAKIAAGQPDEDTGFSDSGGFTLDAEEDLVDGKCVARHEEYRIPENGRTGEREDGRTGEQENRRTGGGAAMSLHRPDISDASDSPDRSDLAGQTKRGGLHGRH